MNAHRLYLLFVFLVSIPLVVLLLTGKLNVQNPFQGKTSAPKPIAIADLKPEQILAGRVEKKDYKKVLEEDVQKTFTAPSHKEIHTNMALADNEPNPNKRYSYYAKAFAEMKKAYVADKKLPYMIVMLELKDYADAFPSYKPSDFVLP